MPQTVEDKQLVDLYAAHSHVLAGGSLTEVQHLLAPILANKEHPIWSYCETAAIVGTGYDPNLRANTRSGSRTGEEIDVKKYYTPLELPNVKKSADKSDGQHGTGETDGDTPGDGGGSGEGEEYPEGEPVDEGDEYQDGDAGEGDSDAGGEPDGDAYDEGYDDGYDDGHEDGLADANGEEEEVAPEGEEEEPEDTVEDDMQEIVEEETSSALRSISGGSSLNSDRIMARFYSNLRNGV